MDERILEIAGKQLLILLTIKKGINTINKDNYKTLSRSIKNLLPSTKEKSPHKILNTMNNTFDDV